MFSGLPNKSKNSAPRFEEPVLRSESLRRILSCDVRPRDCPPEFSPIHVVAVHAPSASRAADLEQLGAQFEDLLQNTTVVPEKKYEVGNGISYQGWLRMPQSTLM